MTNLELHNLTNEIGMAINNIAGDKATTEEVITALTIVGMNICSYGDVWDKDELKLSEYAELIQKIFDKVAKQINGTNDEAETSYNSPRMDSKRYLN